MSFVGQNRYLKQIAPKRPKVTKNQVANECKGNVKINQLQTTFFHFLIWRQESFQVPCGLSMYKMYGFLSWRSDIYDQARPVSKIRLFEVKPNPPLLMCGCDLLRLRSITHSRASSELGRD